VSEQEITLKNTKTEIFEALQQALKRAELAEKGKLNPEKEEKEKNQRRKPPGKGNNTKISNSCRNS